MQAALGCLTTSFIPNRRFSHRYGVLHASVPNWHGRSGVANDLITLIRLAQQNGWATTDAVSFDVLLRHAKPTLWPVSNRDTGPVVDLLRPTDADEAHQRSLSALVGLGEQPLHTDGAHHVAPPDYIVLSCPQGSGVPTFLWRFRSHDSDNRPVEDLRNGLFTVRAGNSCFLAPSLTITPAQLRYDPGCMSPADGRASRASEYLNSRRAESIPFQWDTPGRVLVIDNSNVLH